jgi:hypothetical protein
MIWKEYNKLIDVTLSIAVKLLIAVGVCFECERLKDLFTLL